MTKEEYCERFIAEMLRIALPRSHFDDGDSIREYATDVAPYYYEDDVTKDIDPEEAAQTDVSYWEE